MHSRRSPCPNISLKHSCGLILHGFFKPMLYAARFWSLRQFPSEQRSFCPLNKKNQSPINACKWFSRPSSPSSKSIVYKLKKGSPTLSSGLCSLQELLEHNSTEMTPILWLFAWENEPLWGKHTHTTHSPNVTFPVLLFQFMVSHGAYAVKLWRPNKSLCRPVSI